MSKVEECAKYERMYGATVPLPYGTDRKCSTQLKIAYSGCCIENEKITFSFSPSSVLYDEFQRIEMVFRNRLGRKISYLSSYDYISILLNPEDVEEAGQYMTAALILDNYYRGKEQAAYQKAEYKAFRMGEDWRSPSVVKAILEKGI